MILASTGTTCSNAHTCMDLTVGGTVVGIPSITVHGKRDRTHLTNIYTDSISFCGPILAVANSFTAV